MYHNHALETELCPWCNEKSWSVMKSYWKKIKGKDRDVIVFLCGSEYYEKKATGRMKDRVWLKTCRKKKSRWDSLLKPLSSLRG